MSDKHEEFLAFMRACEHRARCYVQGSAYHEKLKSVQPVSGGWSIHFRDHPRVQEAEREGWSRDLRAACVAECKRRLMAGEDLGSPDDLMPTRRQWWDGVRSNAERFRAAEAFREQVLGPVQADARPAIRHRVDRDAWRARRAAKAQSLESATGKAISDISRRMIGEAAE